VPLGSIGRVRLGCSFHTMLHPTALALGASPSASPTASPLDALRWTARTVVTPSAAPSAAADHAVADGRAHGEAQHDDADGGPRGPQRRAPPPAAAGAGAAADPLPPGTGEVGVLRAALAQAAEERALSAHALQRMRLRLQQLRLDFAAALAADALGGAGEALGARPVVLSAQRLSRWDGLTAQVRKSPRAVGVPRVPSVRDVSTQSVRCEYPEYAMCRWPALAARGGRGVSDRRPRARCAPHATGESHLQSPRSPVAVPRRCIALGCCAAVDGLLADRRCKCAAAMLLRLRSSRGLTLIRLAPADRCSHPRV
jgi:hypothetical protein